MPIGPIRPRAQDPHRPVRFRCRNVLRAGLVLVPSVALGSGCGPSAGPAEAPGLQSDMYAHFTDALEMRRGALFADLEAIREAGREMARATEQEGLPAGSETFAEELRELGRDAADAEWLEEGIQAAARVANACGSCHQTYDVGPRFVLGTAPPATTLGTHMAGQAWVSRLLWDGLIGPSDELWDVGAQELTTTPAFPEEMLDVAGDPEYLRETQDRLRQLGEDALVAPEPDAKAEILADVWSTCSLCHQRAGVRR